MKKIASLFILLIFPIAVFSQKSAPQSKTATVTFSLLDLPGIANEKSSWEVSFELRLTNETIEYEASKVGRLKNMSEGEKIGDLIYKNSFIKKSLADSRNRKVVLQIPLSEEIQKKLENEPKNRINLSKVKITDEIIKKSREDEARAQVFLLYATAIVYDAKLKKNAVIPLNFLMNYRNYPSLNFSVNLKLTSDGYSANINLSEDKTLRTTTVKPQTQ